MSDTSLVELRIGTEREPDGSTESIKQSTDEDLIEHRQRFEIALYEAIAGLSNATQISVQAKGQAAQSTRLSWVDTSVMQLYSKTENQAALFEQVLSDMVQDFGFVCRFDWTDIKDVPLRPNSERLLVAWADFVVFLGAGASLVTAEVKGAHTQLRTSLDAASWRRGVEAIRRRRWLIKGVGDRRRNLYTPAESSITDPVGKNASWAQALVTAADNGDEIAFEQERSRVDWSARSAQDFATATRLALRAGAHMAAREFAITGLQRFPNDRELRNLVEVLAPPRVASQSNPSHHAALAANVRWLREQGPSYRGLWVALRAGQLVASADSRAALHDQIALTNGANRADYVLTRVA